MFDRSCSANLLTIPVEEEEVEEEEEDSFVYFLDKASLTLYSSEN